MVVNTVNYYNRDNWTDLPAMDMKRMKGLLVKYFQFQEMMV